MCRILPDYGPEAGAIIAHAIHSECRKHEGQDASEVQASAFEQARGGSLYPITQYNHIYPRGK